MAGFDTHLGPELSPNSNPSDSHPAFPPSHESSHPACASLSLGPAIPAQISLPAMFKRGDLFTYIPLESIERHSRPLRLPHSQSELEVPRYPAIAS